MKKILLMILMVVVILVTTFVGVIGVMLYGNTPTHIPSICCLIAFITGVSGTIEIYKYRKKIVLIPNKVEGE